MTLKKRATQEGSTHTKKNQMRRRRRSSSQQPRRGDARGCPWRAPQTSGGSGAASSCFWCWRGDAYVGGGARCRFCLQPRFPALEEFDAWLEAVEAWRRHTGVEAADRREADADWVQYMSLAEAVARWRDGAMAR